MLFEKQTELIQQLVEWQSKQDEHTKEQIRLLSEINARQDIEGQKFNSTCIFASLRMFRCLKNDSAIGSRSQRFSMEPTSPIDVEEDEPHY